MRTLLAVAAFAAALWAGAALTAPEAHSCVPCAETTTTTAPRPPTVGPVGVVGCSNTRQATNGYTTVSGLDRLADTARGRATVTAWAAGDPRAWRAFDTQAPPGGYPTVWVQLCEQATAGLTAANIDGLLARLWDRNPQTLVVMSPLNFYADDSCAVTGGNLIPAQGAVFADAYASSHALVVRGPDIGPLGPGELAGDGCHLSAAGELTAGGQLTAYFD